MGRIHFPSPIELTPLGNGLAVLCHDYLVPVFGEWVTIPQGFKTDYASVPRWVTPFIQRTELGAVAPVVHDFLYQRGGCVGGLQLSRRQVDTLFRLYMRLEQVPAWRRGVAWVAVRCAGWACWRKGARGLAS
jgi:hypothetical protein